MQLADLNVVDMHYKKKKIDNLTNSRSKNPFGSTFNIPLKLTKLSRLQQE